MDENETIGCASIKRWGSHVLTAYGNHLIPVHDLCRCRIVAGQWVHEPDACNRCQELAYVWNSLIQMPEGYSL